MKNRNNKKYAESRETFYLINLIEAEEEEVKWSIDRWSMIDDPILDATYYYLYVLDFVLLAMLCIYYFGNRMKDYT